MADNNEITKEGSIPANPVVTTVQSTEAVVPQQGVSGVIDQAQQQQQQQILQPTPHEQAFIDAQKAGLVQPTEIGNPGVQSLMPGINQPIRVGGYSGSIVGSNDIFVPTGDVYGFGVDMERRKAEEQAKINQDAAEGAIGSKWKPLVSQELKDKRFQKSIVDEGNKITNEFLADAQSIYGEDYKYVLENPTQFEIGRDYAKKMQGLDLLVSRGNQITDELAAMRTSIDAGEKIYSDETLKYLNEYENLLGSFANGDPNALIEMQDKLGQIQGGKSIDTYMHQQGVLSQVQGQILGGTGISPSDFGGYATLSTSDKEIFDKNIDNLTNAWIGPNGAFRNEFLEELVTKESLTDHLRGYLQNKVKRSSKMQDVTQGGGKVTKVSEVAGLIGSGDTQSFTAPDGGTYKYNSVAQLKLPTVNHKISTAGLSYISPGGNEVPIEGVKDIQIVSIEKAGDPTTFQSAIGVDSGIDEGTIYAVGVYDVEVPLLDPYTEEPTGKMQTKTVSIPLLYDDALEDAIETDADKLNIENGVTKEAVSNMSGPVKFN